MTDVELLPMPDADGELVIHMAGRPVEIDAFRPSTLRAYTRACVAHATAAKDAEIEALRAERDLFRDETIELVRQNGEWQASAERLAEALREIEQHAWIRGNGDLLQFARAALNPTAAQENDDA